MLRVLTISLLLWALGAAVFRVAVVPAEICPPVAADDARASAVAAGEWLETNLDAAGRFTYGYDRSTGSDNPGYSLARHGGATVSLFQLAAAGEHRFIGPADAALDYLLQRRIDHADWSAIADSNGRAPLGVAGFAVVALSMRRDLTGETQHDDLLRRLGRFIEMQQEPSGALLAFWNPETGRAVPDRYGPFATGEAVWALVELDRRFPGEGWWETAEPTLHYLASGARERNEGEVARLPDHWAAYALDAAGPARLDEALVAYARRLAGYFSLRVRVESQRTGTGLNLLVRWHPGPPSGVGTAAEGMAALWRLSRSDPRLADLNPDMAERMACAAGTMVQRQVNADAVVSGRPEREVGAWFYRNYTQVDDQQHVLSGQLGAVEALSVSGGAG